MSPVICFSYYSADMWNLIPFTVEAPSIPMSPLALLVALRGNHPWGFLLPNILGIKARVSNLKRVFYNRTTFATLSSWLVEVGPPHSAQEA